MRKEDQVILELIKNKASADFIEHTLENKSFNFNYFITILDNHKIKPCALNKLASISTGMPSKLGSETKHAVAEVTIHNRKLIKEIEIITGLLKKNLIEPVILKGPALDPDGLRTAEDIDMLIKIQKIEKAIKILENAGYCYVGDSMNLILNKKERKNITLQLPWNNQYQLKNNVTGQILELHTNLFERERAYDINLDVLLDNINSFIDRKIWNSTLRCHTMNNEDSLILMCMHNAIKRSPSNNRFTLRNLVDIDFLISRGIEWHDFIDRTLALHIVPFVLFSLTVTKKFMDTDIPEQTFSTLQKMCSPWDLRIIRIHLKCVHTLESSSILYTNLYKLLCPFVYHHSWRLRLKKLFLIDVLFPSRHRMAAIYRLNPGNPLVYCTYLLNPLRWIYLALKNIFPY